MDNDEFGIGKPIPQPSRSELAGNKRKEFISRCIGILSHAHEFEDARIRGGVCATQWERAKKRQHKKHADWVRKAVNTDWKDETPLDNH